MAAMALFPSFLRLANHHAWRGTLRLANSALSPRRPLRVRVDGHTVYAPTLDRLVTLWIRRLSTAERFEVECWRGLIRPGAVVADVGANLGLFTLLAARSAGPEGHVHSFEPDPANASALARSVKANGYGTVTIHRAAVAEACGTIPLYLRAEHRGDHRIYRPPTREGGERRAIEVPAVTLDSLFGAEQRLDAVKLDIQGAEGRAIAGMGRTLDASPGLVLMFEFWPEGLRQCGTDPRALLEGLRARGLVLEHVDNARRRLARADTDELLRIAARSRYVNLLARRADG
jgi:FkbM family methyltransferase